jgi:Uma2 family endonuclease
MVTTIANTGTVPSVRRADQVVGKPQGEWTYEDYIALPDDGNRYEIIEGVLYQMPSPNRNHQNSFNWFIHYLCTYVVKVGLGTVLGAPFDVKLPTRHSVQPDVMVILKENEHIIEENRIFGAPDLIIEISSPGTVGYDRGIKQWAYESSGIKEYWLADPATQTIEVLVLKQGKYQSLGVFDAAATYPSQVVPNLPVKVQEFFA